MTPEDLYALFRSDIVDAAQPYLWSDVEVWGYMDDAHKQFARLTGGISDSSSPLTQLAVSKGDVWTDIDPRILKIRHASKVKDGRDIQITNFEDYEFVARDNDYGQPRMAKLTLELGPMAGMVVGMERGKVRWTPLPDADEDVALIVYRLPLETIGPQNAQQPPFEIEEFHHRPLLHWMKKLAYDKQDAETFDKSRSVECEQKFLAYCEEAKHERELREHKYRTVMYGGI